MHTEKEHIDPDTLAAMGYERRDVNVKGLKKAVAIFYAFAIGSALFAAFILYWGVNIWFIRIDPYMARTTTQEKNAFANRESRILPQAPNPLIQNNVTSKVEIHEMRQAEEARLLGTGYTDDTHTRVYIPIEKAKEILLQEGLPKTGSVAAVSQGTTVGAIDSQPNTQPTTGVGAPGGASATSPGTGTPAPAGTPEVNP